MSGALADMSAFPVPRSKSSLSGYDNKADLTGYRNPGPVTESLIETLHEDAFTKGARKMVKRGIFALLLLGSAAPAQAESVFPTSFGDWKSVCTSQHGCKVFLRTYAMERYRNRVSDTGLDVSVDSVGNYRVTSYGSNSRTCGKIGISEEVRLGPRPRDEKFYDQFVSRMQGRVLETMRSHLQIIGNCTPMGVSRGSVPIELLDNSLEDFRAATSEMAESVRRRSPGRHKPLRPANP